MAIKVVVPIATTKTLLTVESKDGQGRPMGELCDRSGKVLGKDRQHEAREVFLDGASGDSVMRISHEEMLAEAEKGGEFYQGHGDVQGWFIDAPDYTLLGRYGDKEAA